MSVRSKDAELNAVAFVQTQLLWMVGIGDHEMNFVNILVRVLEYGCQPWNLTDGAPAAWLHRRHRRSAQVAKEPSAAKDQGTDQLYRKEWTPFKRRLHLFSLSRCSRSGPCHFTRWPFSLTPQGPLLPRVPQPHGSWDDTKKWGMMKRIKGFFDNALRFLFIWENLFIVSKRINQIVSSLVLRSNPSCPEHTSVKGRD